MYECNIRMHLTTSACLPHSIIALQHNSDCDELAWVHIAAELTDDGGS